MPPKINIETAINIQFIVWYIYEFPFPFLLFFWKQRYIFHLCFKTSLNGFWAVAGKDETFTKLPKRVHVCCK